ncbi:MAG TPA: hypothetical protein VJ672_01490 [Gemmatimonadaceae bacterium]|nr:hypothetical protein [Gemmatimonadaceae bacterium]
MLEKETPDHHDADLLLKLYDLRREDVMRASRNSIREQYWPKTADEALAVTKPSHPLNAAYRQVGTYWEMAYGMARHGIIHADYMVEFCGEGLLLFAKIEPYLAEIRKTQPRAFVNAEWVATTTDMGKRIMESMRKRVKERA